MSLDLLIHTPLINLVDRELCYFSQQRFGGGKVLTKNQLKKRVFSLQASALCKEDEEKLDHLLLHCPSVWGYWVALFSLTRMDMPFSG